MSESVEMVRAIVESAGPDLRRAVQKAVAIASQNNAEQEVLNAFGSQTSPAFLWIVAALSEKVNGAQAAKPLWESVVAQNGCEIPEVLLHRARILAREGESTAAASMLKLALENSRSYDLYVRAEAIARKCRAGFQLKHRVKVALLASSTTSFLKSVMELLFLRDGFDAELFEPPFATYAQELLSADSDLKAFDPDFIVLLLNWRDLGLSDISSSEAEVYAAAARIKTLWVAANRLSPRKIIQLTFSPPAFDASLALSSLTAHGKSRAIRKINETLYEQAEDSVVFIDSERISQTFEGRWEDSLLWSSAKAYPAPAALPTLGEHIVSLIRAEMGLSRKLLVLDLDNTMWGGVVGEDGIGGIKLGPPSAIGERYQELHRYVKDLRARGILLAVASKNNMDDAKEVLLHHPNSVLTPDDFVSFKVNWNAKADSIKQISSELSLGLDSFVFLDDNPAERSAIRRELPEVIVPEICGEPAESIAALESGLYFQATRLTKEDQSRAESYSAKARQTELLKTTLNLEDYLTELNMEVTQGPIDELTSSRVTQLVNKTNQFNLTTPRYSLAEVQARAASPNYWCQWYRLKDRFADHGLIGVLIARIGKEKWEVDTWLMSCRVIGREVESYMFRALVESARRSGAKEIVAEYRPTAKNDLVARLLSRFGFTELENQNTFVLDLAIAKAPECKFLRRP